MRILLSFLLVLQSAAVGPTKVVGPVTFPLAGGTTALWAKVQYAQTLGTSSTLAFNVNVTSGNVVKIYMWYGGGSGLTLTATDSLSTSISTLGSANLSTDGDTMAVACGVLASGGADTVTFKSAGSPVAMAAIIEEWSGGTCILDGALTTNHTAATGSVCGGPSPPSVTTTASNSMAFQVCGITSNLTFSPIAGWFHNVGDFDVAGDGLVYKSSQTLYTAATVTGGDTWTGGNKENVAIVYALKAATGSLPTNPSMDRTCTSGNIQLQNNETCSITVSASAISLLVQTYMDSANSTVTEVCLYPSGNTYSSTCAAAGGTVGYLLGRSVQSSPQQNTTETWTFYHPTTGSQKITVHWATGDLTSFGAVSLLGGQGAFNLAGTTGSTGSPISASITSATNHLVIDQLMVGQVSTCQTAPSAGGGQTQQYSSCNGSGNWWYVSSTKAGASSVSMSWTLTSPVGEAMGVVDAF